MKKNRDGGERGVKRTRIEDIKDNEEEKTQQKVEGTSTKRYFFCVRERGHPVVYYQICIIYFVPSIHNIH